MAVGSHELVAGDENGEMYVWDLRGPNEVVAPPMSLPLLCSHSQNGDVLVSEGGWREGKGLLFGPLHFIS